MRPSSAAPLFAALGDETRLRLVKELSGGEARSITRLSEGTTLTRQAVTKHLKVLEGAGLVRSVREGRSTLFALQGTRLEEARRYLDSVSEQWGLALERLKAFVEK